jgi:hypothetical protein
VVDGLNSSGMASSAVLMTVVAMGAAAGIVVDSGSEDIVRTRVVHRGPPGPAQIELAEAETLPVADVATGPLALFGVDAATAVSVACGSTTTRPSFTPERVVCELADQAMERIPKVDADYLALLLPTG